MSHPSRDDRDEANADIEAINNQSLYAMYSVFAVSDVLPGDLEVESLVEGIGELGVTVRGFYDLGGFRADADLMIWMTSDDAAKLQAAYHLVRSSDVGAYLDPVWSNMGTHRPAEFNRTHVPSCFAGFAPRPWICVYPFVRSFEWYNLPDSERATMLREHGVAGREFPDVVASTLASFALGDYEWLLAFEADDLHQLVDVMRRQRSVDARAHVREETPFFTGPRVELGEWVSRQPSR